MELLEEPQDGLASGLVQVASRFVGQHDGRAAHQRSGHGDPLALPARELVGPGLGPAIKPDHGEGVEGLGAPFDLGNPGVKEPVRHVVEHALVLGQKELLEHEADPRGPQGGELAVRELGEIEAGDPHMARARPVQTAHQVQKGGLTRPRRPHDAHQFALTDAKGDTPQGGDGRLARVDLDHLVHFEHWPAASLVGEKASVVEAAGGQRGGDVDGHRFGTTML